jgi:hypothetical protein
MPSTRLVDDSLLSGSDDFLYRIMVDYKAVIRSVANRFRHLDPMYDTDDLEQEAFFGVRMACNSWAQARAIKMQFKTYLTWHISRHFQGKFHGDDKVVDLIDEQNNVRVTIPWSKYKKTGRAAAKARNYRVRIRSLLVYYDAPLGDALEKERTPSQDCHPVHTGDDTVVDIFDRTGTLIVTVPRRNFLRVRELVEQQHYTVREYSIYDPPPARTTTLNPSAVLLPTLGSASSPEASDPDDTGDRHVVDVYTEREVFLTSMPMARYEMFRHYFPKYGLKAQVRNATVHTEPLEYADSGARIIQPRARRQALPTA